MIGQLVDGKYELLELIGEGGMGAVYEARHASTGALVAVKLIHADFLDKDDVMVARFEREARAAALIATKYIVQVTDAGRDDALGQPYMAMELLRGESLLHILHRLGPLSPELVVKIGAQVCLGLEKAHAAGVVHRDIKPANLFLARGTEEGDEIVCKLLDFGVAKLKMEQAASTENVALTRTGSMLGSPLYMSPEQARGLKTIDARADIFSLGVVLYQLLCGRTPNHEVEGLGELIINICSDEARPVRSQAPWVPERIAAAVHGALQIAPKARYQTAGDMLEALRKSIDAAPGEEPFVIRDEMLQSAEIADDDTHQEPENLEATMALDTESPAAAAALPQKPQAPPAIKRTLPLPTHAAPPVGAATPLAALEGGGTLALDAAQLAALEAAPLAGAAGPAAGKPVGRASFPDPEGDDDLAATMALDSSGLVPPAAGGASDQPGDGEAPSSSGAMELPRPAKAYRPTPPAEPNRARKSDKGSNLAIMAGIGLGVAAGGVGLFFLLRGTGPTTTTTSPHTSSAPVARTSASAPRATASDLERRVSSCIAGTVSACEALATGCSTAASDAAQADARALASDALDGACHDGKAAACDALASLCRCSWREACAKDGASPAASGSASATTSGTKVTIVQPVPGMTATVDGLRVDIVEGAITLAGAPGDKRLVALSLQGSSKTWEVTIGKDGTTQPASIGPLPLGTAPAPSIRPTR